MTARTARRAPRGIGPTYALAAIAFTGVLGGLVAQVQAGADPALGAAQPAAQLDRPRYVIVHRVVRRKVVTRVVYDRPAVGTSTTVAGGGAAAPRVASSSSGASAAPAPAPVAVAAAPAPAPAVSAPVTRAS